MKNKLFFLVCIFVAVGCKEAPHAWQLTAPSGKISVKVSHNSGKISYEICALNGDQKTIVLPKSPLGIIRNDGDFTQNLKFVKAGDPHVVEEKYTMIAGNKKDLQYAANAFELTFSNDQNKNISLEFRAFDDGIAFRYIFPETDTTSYTILSEATGFSLPSGIKAWMAPYELAKPWGQPGYESEYMEVTSGTPSADSVGWAFPMLFKNNDTWVFISEAGLDEHYCATHINKNCDSGKYIIAFPQHEERYGDALVNPSSTLPWKMPWRVIVVGKDLKDIVECNLVNHLSEPCAIEDTSWIRPGRASWEWWSSTAKPTVKRLKEFVDLAAEMGWEYSLVDAGWDKMIDGTIEDLAEYAKKKGVGLTLWYNSGGRRDSLAHAEDFVMYVPEAREREMSRIQQMGIKGIKVDFFASDKQRVIQLYQEILRDAARHHLVVDFHGCTLPRGWSRTYPNLLTMEAVRGAECYRFAESYPASAARYNAIAALIRSSVGTTDYTPTTFSNHKFPHLTTFAHELALTVVYQSGMIHMADRVEAYHALPVDAKDFLKNVPASWDESILIQAVPGELFIIARKNGNAWYVAGINGKKEIQKASFILPFNLKGAKIISDGNKPSELIFQNKEINEKEKIEIEMQPSGGFVITGIE